MISDSYEKAERLSRHNATRTIPDRTVCASTTDKKTKKCPVAHLCFNMR